MAKDTDLIGLGMAPALGALDGYQIGAVTAAGTSSTTATDLGTNSLVAITTASSQTGVRLNASTPLGKPIVVNCLTSDSAVVFPPANGTINGGTATTGGLTVAQTKTAIFWRNDATKWFAILTA